MWASNEDLLYCSQVAQPSSAENLSPLIVSLPNHTEDFSPLSSSSSSSELLSPLHPSEATPIFLSSEAASTSTVPLAAGIHCPPLTPRTLLSHPNYQSDTPVRLRPLAGIAPPSTAVTPSPPLTQAHLSHAISTTPSLVSNSLESSANSLQSTNPISDDFSPDDPFSYLKALHSPDAAQWVKAMTEEIGSLRENKTWELVRLPDGRKAIQCKWVFKTKYLPNGDIDKFKARLVAKGYTQKAGIDYTETFSPVVKFETVRIVMAITAADDLEIVQFDIKTAFLNGDIAELLYMEQPEGFVDLIFLIMYVFSEKLSTVSNNPPEIGIRSLILFFSSLGLPSVTPTPAPTIHPKAGKLSFCSYMWMMDLSVTQRALTSISF